MRDSLVTDSLLRAVDSSFSNFGRVFIDCLHNNAADKQCEVIRQLIFSDIVVVIDSPMLPKSPWVALEICLAVFLKKPIIIFNRYHNVIQVLRNKPLIANKSGGRKIMPLI